jgi:hypothetical protein
MAAAADDTDHHHHHNNNNNNSQAKSSPPPSSATQHVFQFEVVAHAACWRPALASSVARWPALWDPVEPEAIGAIEGLGSYRRATQP